MSNLAVAGWEYLVNALDGFWCVQLRAITPVFALILLTVLAE
jgi:hypothetical protein